MKDLIILGTGIHALEMAEIVERMNLVSPTWKVLGFLTMREEHIGQVLHGYPVLGTNTALEQYPDTCVVPDNDWPRTLDYAPGCLVSIIDPSVFVSRSARIGAGCVIYPGCYIGVNAVLGNYVFSLSGSIINHDDIIEDRVIITSGVTLAGSVHVESDCYLGQACNIRQLLRIGHHSFIGMGAVIVKDVPSHSVMAGNPARRLRENK